MRPKLRLVFRLKLPLLLPDRICDTTLAWTPAHSVETVSVRDTDI